MIEIGSDFWAEEYLDNEDKRINYIFQDCEIVHLLSGRTALDYIIRDMSAAYCMLEQKIAYLPSYCCHTMIEPFTRNGFCIKYYHLQIVNGGMHFDFDFENNAKVVLLLDYFGFLNPEVARIAREERRKGKVVIYDATQSIFCSGISDVPADYFFASYRKWFGSFTAIAIKRGIFRISDTLEYNSKYVNVRRSAMAIKAEYIRGERGEKDEYRMMFEQAEKMLEYDYMNYKAAKQSAVSNEVDLTRLIERRRNNASVLMAGIQALKNDTISLLLGDMKTGDCPLFVPVIVKQDARKRIRDYLTQRNFYCPIHWPISNLHCKYPLYQQLYQEELSLVCDQRYESDHMISMLDALKGYVKDNEKR